LVLAAGFLAGFSREDREWEDFGDFEDLGSAMEAEEKKRKDPQLLYMRSSNPRSLEMGGVVKR
jgi:hypothetical protein